MKITSKTLSDFVNDFKLAKPDGCACFTATIDFSTEFKTVQLETEVQIVSFTAKHMSAIYLLHPDVVKHGIPGMIQDNNGSISYLPNKYLLIKGVVLIYVNYVLIICPENSGCSPETLQELRAKKNN